MSSSIPRQAVLTLLQGLNGLEPLKQLFWSELNYERVNQSLSRRGWSDTAKNALADDPVLFAAGGENQDFHIIYARLAEERLLLGLERPVISRLLQDHPYALFVFSNEAQDRWHFVNVKYDTETEKRRLFRRITAGATERLRTAAERLSLLDLETIADKSPLSIQQQHDEAFDVEAVTKAFFTTFAELYHKVVDDISKVRELKDEAGKLAQLLLDRMMFLYFIQKKGWLNQEPDYLFARFRDIWNKDPRGTSYYSDVLYPLFLCLSNTDTQVDSVGHVPFLNGGLFEESIKLSQSESLEQARLQIRNVTFKAIFDDLLERFNFTVMEDTPLDVEIAIDPEMLGKIFESLILELEKDPEKDLRKLTGSYYTPRAIVHFMCQEALKEFLAAQVAGHDTAAAKSMRGKLHALLTLPPAEQLDDEQIKDLQEVFTAAEAKGLRQAIFECRVCDPAVGSGAFPVGILHEMVSAVARLDVCLNGREPLERRNYDYELKKRIIEACLYGVDIQDQAVRLCELRLWLSLVVDYQIDPRKPFATAVREVPSLPNLSYRIMRGDSLLERLFGHVVQLDEMSKDRKTKALIESIQVDKQAYFREGDTAEKRRLELSILLKQAELAERLIDAKRAALTGYQPALLGEDWTTVRARKAEAEYAMQIAELEDLRVKVSKAKSDIGRIVRQKAGVSRSDLDALRRHYFHTGDAPTFMWHVDCAEAFLAKNGFDIVIGNPPYLSARRFQDIKSELLDVYSTPHGSYDIYILFMERGVNLLNDKGLLCFITSNKYLLADYGALIREFLRIHSRINLLIDLADCTRVFDALVSPAITLVSKGQTHPTDPIRIAILKDHEFLDIPNATFVERDLSNLQRKPKGPFDIYIRSRSGSVLARLENGAEPLSSLGLLRTGIMGFDYWALEPYLEDKAQTSNKDLVRMVTNSHIEPFIFMWGKEIRLYKQRFSNPRINLNIDLINDSTRRFFRSKKVIMRGVATQTTAAWDNEGHALLVAVHGFAPDGIDGMFVTGLLNSELFNWIHRIRFYAARIPKGSLRYPISFWEGLPIRTHPKALITEIAEVAKQLSRRNVKNARSLHEALNRKVMELYEVSAQDLDKAA